MRGWFALLGLVGGCVLPRTMCTEIGCAGGLSVMLLSEEPLADGAWEVAVTQQDGTSASCAFTVQGGAITASQDCAALEVLEEDEGVRLQFLEVDGDVNVTVTQDGAEQASEDFAPEYEEFRPNGPDCPPVCRSASVEVALD